VSSGQIFLHICVSRPINIMYLLNTIALMELNNILNTLQYSLKITITIKLKNNDNIFLYTNIIIIFSQDYLIGAQKFHRHVQCF